jgi:hypothetical protein
MPIYNYPWTQQDDDLLRELVAAIPPIPSREIGIRLGRSKSAVIARARRIKAEFSVTPGFKIGHNGNAARKLKEGKTLALQPKTRTPCAPSISETGFTKSAPKTADIAFGEGGGVTLENLFNGMCRWPVGDVMSESFRYCGDKIHKGSYCCAHAQLAYIKPAPLKLTGRSFAFR